MLVVFIARYTLPEPHVWTDAAIGKHILNSLSVPHTDVFSFASDGKPMVAESWLYSVLIYVIIALFGIAGVHFFKLLLIVLLCLMLVNLSYKRRWNTGIAGVLLIVGFYLFRDLLIMRAQLFALFLFAVFFYLLSQFRSGRKRGYLYYLPVVMWVWANSHPSFVIGLVTAIIFFLSELTKKSIRQKFSLWYGRTFKWRVIVHIGLTVLACFVAVVFNPYFLSIFDHAFTTLSATVLYAVIDWYTFERVMMFSIPFLSITVFVVLCMFFVPPRRSDITDAAVLVALFVFAYFFKRYTAFPFLWAIMLGIKYFSAILDMIVKELRFFGRDYRPIGYIFSALFFFALTSGAWAYYCLNHASGRFAPVAAEYSCPVDAVEYIKSNGLDPNVYTPFYYGGYFLYALYPLYKNFSDYHTLYVDEQILLNDQRIREADIGWEWNLEEYDIKTFLIPYQAGKRNLLNGKSRFNEKLHQSPYWKLVYWDDYNLIYKNVDAIISDTFKEKIYMTLDVEDMMRFCTDDPLEQRELKRELIRRKEQKPSSGWCNVFLGILSMRGGDMQTGKEYFELAYKINPDVPKIRLFKEVIDWHENGALQSLSEKIAFYDSGTEGLLQAAFTLMATGLYIDANRVIETVLKTDDKNIEAYILKGICSDYLGDYVDSLVALNNALKINPNEPEILYYLGKIYQNNQIWDQAAQVIRVAIEKDGRNYKYWYTIAEIYLQSGNIDDALAMCKKTVHFRPHFFDAWILGGNLFRKLGRYNESLEVLGKAYILNPFSERLFLELTQTYLFLEQPQKAEEMFAKISDRLFIEAPHYLFVNARFAALKGNEDEAYEFLKKALEKDFSDISIELKRCKEFKELFQTERFRKLLR